MKIGEIIRSKDIDTYRKLKSIEKKKNKKHRKKKEIELILKLGTKKSKKFIKTKLP